MSLNLVNKAWYLTKNGKRVQLIGYTGTPDEDGDVGVITSRECSAVVQAGGVCADNPELSLVEKITPSTNEAPPPRKKPITVTFET